MAECNDRVYGIWRDDWLGESNISPTWFKSSNDTESSNTAQNRLDGQQNGLNTTSVCTQIIKGGAWHCQAISLCIPLHEHSPGCWCVHGHVYRTWGYLSVYLYPHAQTCTGTCTKCTSVLWYFSLQCSDSFGGKASPWCCPNLVPHYIVHQNWGIVSYTVPYGWLAFNTHVGTCTLCHKSLWNDMYIWELCKVQ